MRPLAVVTGASGGIGSAIARRLAEGGHDVVVGYGSRRDRADEVVVSLGAGDHVACAVDVTAPESLESLASLVAARGNRLAVLVNCVGVTRAVPHADLDGLDDDLFDSIMATNVRGVFATIRALAPALRAAKGCVVSISSVAGVTGLGSNVAYCASKAAVDSMTRSLGRALAPDVRVVSVSPGEVPASSGRSLRVVYAGSGECASAGWVEYGFVAPPSGMVCQVQYPGGRVSDVGYVGGVGGGAQVAMLVSGSESVSLGWDRVGRLVAMRDGLATLVAARAVEAGRDPVTAGVVARIEYDAGTGRVSRLVHPPVVPGGVSVVDRISYPSWALDQVMAGAQVQARVSSSVTPVGGARQEWSQSMLVDARSQQVVSSVDRAGLAVVVDRARDGRVESVTDQFKRKTTYAYDVFGQQVGQSGPFVQDADRGMRVVSSYDGAEQRSGGWRGMRAQVFTRPNFAGDAVGAWWGAQAQDGFTHRWDRRPVGTQDRWSGRATARWTPDSAATDWQFKVESSGAVAGFVVDGEACVPDAAGLCVIRGLVPGPKAVVVQVDEARASGFVQVSAAPVGEPVVPVPGEQVDPVFGVVTEQQLNDTFPGSERTPKTVNEYDEPWTGQSTSSTGPGGLRVEMVSEPVDPARGAFGRLLTRTTPGGQQLRMTYWGVGETAVLPGVCGGGEVRQWSGGARQIVRQDGSTQELFADRYGRQVARVVRGAVSGTQTTCLTYDDDDTVIRRDVFNGDGVLVERTRVVPEVDGDPLTSSTTVIKGPGSPVNPGGQTTTTTTIDLAGRVTSFTDAFGTVTTTTYTAQGSADTVTVTAPGTVTGGGRTLVLRYRYTAAQNWLDKVFVNGQLAADLTYDLTRAQITTITYADGVQADYRYFGNGVANRLTVTTPDTGRWQHQMDLQGTGRILGDTLTATATGTFTGAFTDTRTYTYDTATRLTRAQISSTQPGYPATTDYRYGYGPQDASCPTGYPGAGLDALRTSGSRNGVDYITCYSATGRTLSTTDPALTGGTGTTRLTHDPFGRVTAIGDRTQLVWAADTTLARITDTGTTTELDTYAGRIHTKTVTTPTPTTHTTGYGYAAPGSKGPVMLYDVDGSGAAVGVRAASVGLPGGVTVTIPGSGLAVATMTDLAGAAMVHVPMPALGAGAVSPDVPVVGAAARYGPFGEPLVAPTSASSMPQYQWQAAAGRETLAGGSGIVAMGARPYSPALGQFLAIDPDPGSGNNLYSYTSGDPINNADLSGNSEGCGLLCMGLSAGAAIAAFWGPWGSIIGVLASSASLAMAVTSAKSQGASTGLDNMEIAFASAALAFSGIRLLSFGIGKIVRWRMDVAKKGQAARNSARQSGDSDVLDLFNRRSSSGSIKDSTVKSPSQKPISSEIQSGELLFFEVPKGVKTGKSFSRNNEYMHQSNTASQMGKSLKGKGSQHGSTDSSATIKTNEYIQKFLFDQMEAQGSFVGGTTNFQFNLKSTFV